MENLSEIFERYLALEKELSLDSIVHRMNPVAKLLSFLFVIGVAVYSNSLRELVLLSLIPITLALASRISFVSFLTRSLIFIPIFAGIIAIPVIFLTRGETVFSILFLHATKEGLERFGVFVLRVWICVALLELLVATTGIHRLVGALERLRIPREITMLLYLASRYVFLFAEEARRMIRARESRYLDPERSRMDYLRDIASITGNLIIRAFERGERVYRAMLSRGFGWESERPMTWCHCTLRDYALSLALAIYSLSVVILI